ncbi:MAG: hypothetical protein IPK16_01465 [Anaerolineales bacterium]|nr:hypothetical protein [Anaerolineales bacterium]
MNGIGAALAPIVGGLLAAYSYNLMFALSAMVGIAALWVLLAGVKEPRSVDVTALSGATK